MPSPIEKLLIGRALAERYHVEQLIGRGGMSVVYRAVDRRLDRPVALKVISVPSELGDAEAAQLRERLRREAAAAAKLSAHPNVVQVYDYGTDAELDLDFIAMELLSGTDLKHALREGGPIPGDVLEILLAAAEGVAAGHRAGIVHRDLKPANIFLAATGGGAAPVVKILDFGIAKALDPGPDDDLTHLDQLPHSPAYASPEQLDANARVTAASDVYQLGLVAYEMLAGERPFDDADRQRIRAGDEVELPSRGRWSDVPAAVREVVEKALQPRPDRRFKDATQFGAALRSEVGGTTLHFQPAPAPRPEPTSDETEFLGGDAPKAAPATARRGLPPRALAFGLAGVAALALIFWLGDDGAGDASEEAATPGPAAEVEGIADLDADFSPLIVQAYQRLQEAVSAEEGEEAAEAVQNVIYDVQAAFAEGDLDRLVGHYAEEVEIDGDRTDRTVIRDRRGELIERYSRREVTIPRLAIEFLAPGRARALVDRSWSYAADGSDGEQEDGSGVLEVIVEKTGDRWLITGERELERFE